jgi:hypothetical protein
VEGVYPSRLVLSGGRWVRSPCPTPAYMEGWGTPAGSLYVALVIRHCWTTRLQVAVAGNQPRARGHRRQPASQQVGAREKIEASSISMQVAVCWWQNR